MIKIRKKHKKCKCIVVETFQSFKIGDKIEVVKGYGQFLQKKGYVLIPNRYSKIDSVIEKRIFVNMQQQMGILSKEKELAIERKIKKNHTSLFNPITTDQVIDLICKKLSIHRFNCLSAKFVNISKNNYENKNKIDECGKYQCVIFCQNKEITTLKLIIIGVFGK